MTLIKPLGEILISCKHWLRRDPAIREAWEAYRLAKLNSLQLFYPNGVSAFLMRATGEIDAGLNTGITESTKSD